jgi:hypothetical protein
MRRYSVDQEEDIRAQGMVREWTRSGLLDATQGVRLVADLRVDLRRTNVFLRAGLALFTGLIVAATTGLLVSWLDLREAPGIAAITGLASLACLGLAEYLVATFRCYRFGVEEALAVAAVVLLSICGVELVSRPFTGARPLPSLVALIVGSAGGFGLYRRFGFVYAALGSMACAAAVPFQVDLPSALQRAVAAAVCASIFFIARSKRVAYRDDYPGDEYGAVQAAAWAALYCVLNVQLTGGPGGWHAVDGWFYWSTYVVTWVLPIIGLALGIGDKDRELMDVSIVMALVTLLTNKPYLGWPRRTWDPILLGLFLMAVAIALRRWVAKGPGGERHGFTAAQLLDKDRTAVSLLSMASVLAPGAPTVSDPSQGQPAASPFGGGRSGGGGGGDRF